METKRGYTREARVTYREEEFLVRDNGWVCRLQRPNERERPSDGIWTDGSQCQWSGYMKHVHFDVHRIVATAFHGEPPSPDHVVDHIDTDRSNNRAENLRWVTRLENITLNPKTFRRIQRKWGSIEGMLNDPYRVENTDPISNRPWMRQREEEEDLRQKQEVVSLTPLAVQRNWRTPSEFPMCPCDSTADPLINYHSRLKQESVFSHNEYGESKVERAELHTDGSRLSVITKTDSGVKGWAVAEITFENGTFAHTSRGTFFTVEGAEKAHCEIIGRAWAGGDNFDDYC